MLPLLGIGHKRQREDDLFFHKAIFDVGVGTFTNKLGINIKRDGERDVRVDLNVHYENGKPTRLFVEGSRGLSGEDELCLSVKLDVGKGTLYIESLFNTATPHDCDAWVVGTDGERKGIGFAVMRMLTSIADQLFSGNVTLLLRDGSRFTAERTPLVSMTMTEYFRMKRGFGFYEGLGFMDAMTEGRDTIDDEHTRMREVLEWHGDVFGTPLNAIDGKTTSDKSKKRAWKAIQSKDEYKAMRVSFGDHSIRQILARVEEAAREFRPKLAPNSVMNSATALRYAHP